MVPDTLHDRNLLPECAQANPPTLETARTDALTRGFSFAAWPIAISGSDPGRSNAVCMQGRSPRMRNVMIAALVVSLQQS